jgi:hypothetical protein
MKTYDKPYTTVKVQRNSDGSFRRFDRNDWSSQFDPSVFGHVESWFCAGRTDSSGHYNSIDHYDARCSCCWLGFGHTLDYHNRQVAKEGN